MKESEKTLGNSEERKFSILQSFLWSCAGVDKEILKQCPTEWNKYAGIGATILFTGILASLSGGYALYTVFRNGDLIQIDTEALIPAVLFGILWGLIIFNLDRFIVSTFRKQESNGRIEKVLRELLQASPRMLLAVIIAMVISKPIEIKIFESRLEEQIKKAEIESKKKNTSDINDLNNISGKKNDILDLDVKILELRNELNSIPQNVKYLRDNNLAQANNTLSAIKKTNSSKIENHKRNILAIRNDEQNYRPVLDSQGNVVDNRLTREANDKIKYENKAISILNKEIKDKEAEVKKIKKQIQEEQKKYQEQKQKEIENKKTEKTKAEVLLKKAMIETDKAIDRANKTSERAFTNNFITQIEALGDLTKNNDTMRWASIMIALLFLTIELAPILTKLITKRGPYDEILDITENETIVEQKEFISQKTKERNKFLSLAEEEVKLKKELHIQLQKEKCDTELKSNEIILEKIAKYQQELALKYIEKWYETEKAKLEKKE